MSIQMTCPTATDVHHIAVELSYWQTERDALQVHPGDLGWHSMAGPEKTAANLRIWSRSGIMVALGLLDGPDVLRMAVDPAAQDDDELARQITSDVNNPDVGILPAGKGIIEARSARSLRKHLADEGWTDDEPWTSFHYDFSPPIDHEQIERTQVRVETAGPDEAEAWVTVHWSAFKGTEFGDTDKQRLLQKWKNVTEGPFAHLARHLIAFDRDGNAVAVTTVWSAGKGRPGLIEPMGVHRDHHRRGYGGAIVTAAAEALKDMGSSSARVAAENANPGALATYAKAGFTAQDPVADLKRPARDARLHMPDRLSLRPLRIEDADKMVAVLADPSLYEFTGGTAPTRAELKRRYAIQTRGHSADGTEEWINQIVLLGSQREPVGYVQATIPDDAELAEIAWVIGRPWQGRGYASRAAELLVRELAQRGVGRIIAHIHPEHETSRRIASRLGMAPTHVVVDGEIRWEGTITVQGNEVPDSDTE